MFDQMAMLDSSAMAGGGGVGYHVHKRFFSRICVQMLKVLSAFNYYFQLFLITVMYVSTTDAS